MQLHTPVKSNAITILIEINFAWRNLNSDTFISLEHLFLWLAGYSYLWIIFSDTSLQSSNTLRIDFADDAQSEHAKIH